MNKAPFWKSKTLEQMSRQEWESLCDGCAICCSIRLEDVETGKVYPTSIVCRYLDIEQCQCTCYHERQKFVPECVVLNPQNSRQLDWLPPSCAYHLLAHGKDLPDWHPLLSKDPDSVQKAGISLKNRAISEAFVHPDQWHDFILNKS